MYIPIKVDYGVRALVDLAQHSNGDPVRAMDIAHRSAIPEPFLAQVLHGLSKSGLVRSQRGPQGGHVLAMDPSDINLRMVVECLGAAATTVACLGDTRSCIHIPACAQRELWRSVEEAVFNILDSTSIADLVERTRTISEGATDGNSPQRLRPVAV